MKLTLIITFVMVGRISFAQLIISELQSANSATITDEYGEYEDWIEIYNPNDIVIDIGGLVLKDNVDTWQIPTGYDLTKLEPRSFFLFWADDQQFQGKFHTNFKLSAANGEFLGLYASDSVTVIDSVYFPTLLNGQSYGVCNGTWVTFNHPTPLGPNDCLGSTVSLEQIAPLIYPTIASNEVTINFVARNGSTYELVIYQMDGRRIMNQICYDKTNVIDIRSLKQNLYFVIISDGLNVYSQKIIKK